MTPLKLGDIPEHERKRHVLKNLVRWLDKHDDVFVPSKDAEKIQLYPIDQNHWQFDLNYLGGTYHGTATLSIGTRHRPPLKCRLFIRKEK